MDRGSQLSKDDEDDEDDEEDEEEEERRTRKEEAEEEEEKEEEKEEKEEEEATDIKSNNPHLAGGEPYCRGPRLIKKNKPGSHPPHQLPIGIYFLRSARPRIGSKSAKNAVILQVFGTVTGKKLRKYQRFGIQKWPRHRYLQCFVLSRFS